MPVTSKRANRLRRARRDSTLSRRSLKNSYQAHFRTMATLLTVLASQGGDISVSLTDQKDVLQKMGRLSYTINPDPTDPKGRMSIQLVEQPDALQAGKSSDAAATPEARTEMVSPHDLPSGASVHFGSDAGAHAPDALGGRGDIEVHVLADDGCPHVGD